MAKQYIALTYLTYNSRILLTAAVVLFLYYFFIVKLFIAVKYEILNLREQCDVRFYNSRACRNKIADTILLDPNLSKYKGRFFDNIHAKIKPNLDTATTFIDVESAKIDNNEIKHDSIISYDKATLKSQYKTVSDTLNNALGSISENLSNVLTAFSSSDGLISSLANFRAKLTK
jgi:hypothetical protein